MLEYSMNCVVGRGGGGARSLRGARREGEIPRDLAQGARSRGGRNPWDSRH